MRGVEYFPLGGRDDQIWRAPPAAGTLFMPSLSAKKIVPSAAQLALPGGNECPAMATGAPPLSDTRFS